LCQLVGAKPRGGEGLLAVPTNSARGGSDEQADQENGQRNVLFCCVDRIDTRRLVWEEVEERVDFFADGRMTAEVLRVLTACDPASRDHYPTTLLSQDEAYEGAWPCKEGRIADLTRGKSHKARAL
jgi:hypothetical protein